jgi:uncharacterized protein YceK
MKIRFVATFVATLLLAGCSSTPSARDEALIGLSVQYATAKYIEKKPDSRENIVRIATAAKAIVSASDASVTLQSLQGFVGGELDKLELTPADRALADGLVALIVVELDARVGEGLIPEDQRVRVVRLLDFVIAAAG